jgi:hypothetical protein
VFEQAAKTDAEERQLFQMFFRNIRRALPRREGCAEVLAVAKKRHSNLKESVITLQAKGFQRRIPANDCFLSALRLGKGFCRAREQDFLRRSPSGMPGGFQDLPGPLPGLAAAANTTGAEGFTHRMAEEAE